MGQTPGAGCLGSKYTSSVVLGNFPHLSKPQVSSSVRWAATVLLIHLAHLL